MVITYINISYILHKCVYFNFIFFIYNRLFNISLISHIFDNNGYTIDTIIEGCVIIICIIILIYYKI